MFPFLLEQSTWTRATLERFASEQWLPVHVTPEQAAEIVFDQFKRTVAQAMAVMELKTDQCMTAGGD